MTNRWWASNPEWSGVFAVPINFCHLVVPYRRGVDVTTLGSVCRSRTAFTGPCPIKAR
jgi:hypothetical protein